jgi:hypothetical protein
MESGVPVNVFFSYSHRDENLKDELLKHLSILQRRRVIAAWHDREIGGGGEWAKEIDSHLSNARIILLLVSSDFLASDYCYDIELKRAMDMHEVGQARVVPVILRPCDWSRAPFSRLKALPRDGKAITSWQNLDEAFADVAEGIRGLVGMLLNGQLEPPIVEKLRKAESLRNWPNVIKFAERLLDVAPGYSESARKALARALIARWSENVTVKCDFALRVEVHPRRKDRGRPDYRKTSDYELYGQISSDIDRAIQLDPTNPDYYFVRGCVTGEIEDLTRAIKLAPRDAKSYYSRALRISREDPDGAERDLRRVLELGFEGEQTHFWVNALTQPSPPSWRKIDQEKLNASIQEDLERIWGTDVRVSF